MTLGMRARKVVVDRADVETEVPMNDWVESEVFAPAHSLQGEVCDERVNAHRCSGMMRVLGAQ